MTTTAKPLTLTILDGAFAVHRFAAGASIPKAALASSFFAITRTTDELSIVVPETVNLESEKKEDGWTALKVNGPLDFGLVGVLAGISSSLAESSISIFAISTFDTDYILLKSENIKKAREALTAKGYKVVKPRGKAEEEEKPTGLAANAKVLLETQIPTISKLLVEKVGSAGLAALRNDSALSIALGSVYEFMPTALRLVIPRNVFIDFCLQNRDKVLPKDEKKTKQPRKSEKSGGKPKNQNR